MAAAPHRALAGLLAPAGAPAGVMPETVVTARQADGFDGVYMRPAVGARHSCVIPNGARVTLLGGAVGEHQRVRWQGRTGLVKARNLARPSPAKYADAAAVPPPPPPPGPADNTLSLTINGRQFTIDLASDPTITPKTRLNEFIRTRTPWTGTKRMCGEGGCGSCVVMLTDADGRHRASNSCLRLLLSCNGMAVTTNEGVGSRSKGYHPVQQSLADAGGTQCGYCSSGFVMTMYSYLQDNKGKPITQADVESILDGNVCRCTGYRPIMEAFKSFASDAEEHTPAHHLKRAELFPGLSEHPKAPPRREPVPLPHVSAPRVGGKVHITKEGVEWSDVETEAELQAALAKYAAAATPPKDLMLVSGNTSMGIWKARQPDAQINLKNVTTLNFTNTDAAGIHIGSAAPIADVIDFLKQAIASATPAYKAADLQYAVDHMAFIATHPVRQTATIGGNLMLAHSFGGEYFPSDMVILLTGLSGILTFIDSKGTSVPVTMDKFYTFDAKFKYLKSITIPWLAENQVFRSFKTGMSSRSSRATVNAAMTATVVGGKIAAGSAVIAYGAVKTNPFRATSVEQLLNGVDVTDQAGFQGTLCPAVLAACPAQSWDHLGKYRQSLALSFFYKFMLALQPSLPPALQSAAAPWFAQPVTKASHAYGNPDKSMFPVGQPIPKLEGILQCSGEAEYSGDRAAPADLLHGAPVRSTQVGTIASIDTSKAEACPGFRAFVSGADIPEARNACWGGPVMAAGATDFVGQAVGVVLADTHAHAVEAARAVAVTYSGTKALVVNIADAVAAGSYHPPPQLNAFKAGDAAGALAKSAQTAKQSLGLGTQYHMHMETQTALVVPRKEGGVDVFSATQGPTVTQKFCASVLGLKESEVNVVVSRVGGGYGAKAFLATNHACLAAFCAQTAGAPVKIVAEIEDNMTGYGLRCPWQFDYEVGFEADGTINAVTAQVLVDGGSSNVDAGLLPIPFFQNFDGCYKIANWEMGLKVCKTDVPFYTFARAPGWLPSTYFIESVVTTVARALGKQPMEVREKNFYAKGDVPITSPLPLTGWTMDRVWAQVQSSADYQSRVAAVAAFNKQNRWVKKGLALQPVKYAVAYDFWIAGFDLDMSVCSDGTVSVECGGVEIGQGLNTKVQQVIAYELGIDVSQVRVQPTSTRVCTANGGDDNLTAGSVTSELCGLSAIRACQKINTALAPARKAAGPGASWETVVVQAGNMGIMLAARGNDAGATGTNRVYNSYSAAAVEVKLDVLTGELAVERVDIVFDCGKSLNPAIDVGQVEGGFMMGLGYAVKEAMYRAPATGALESNNTWNYKVPFGCDVPREWNVSLLPDAPNPTGVLSSKCSGEPPLVLSWSALEAASHAVSAARADVGKAAHVIAECPLGAEQRHLACETAAAAFTLR